MTGDLHQAEDVVQEALARAAARWARLCRYDAPEAWVRRVALNLATSQIRHRTRQLAILARIARPAAVPPVSEEAMALVQALGRLPMSQRGPVVLHHLLGVPVEEVAEQLGISASAANPPGVAAACRQGRRRRLRVRATALLALAAVVTLAAMLPRALLWHDTAADAGGSSGRVAAEVQYWRGLGFDSVSPIVVIAEGAHAGVHWRAVAFKDHNHPVCMAVGPAGREHDSGSACWRDHDGWSQGPVAERGDDFVYGWVDARAERVRLVAAGAPAVQTDVIAVPKLGTRMFVAPAPKSPGARSATVREVILLDAAGHVLCRVTTGEHPC